MMDETAANYNKNESFSKLEWAYIIVLEMFLCWSSLDFTFLVMFLKAFYLLGGFGQV